MEDVADTLLQVISKALSSGNLGVILIVTPTALFLWAGIFLYKNNLLKTMFLFKKTEQKTENIENSPEKEEITVRSAIGQEFHSPEAKIKELKREFEKIKEKLFIIEKKLETSENKLDSVENDSIAILVRIQHDLAKLEDIPLRLSNLESKFTFLESKFKLNDSSQNSNNKLSSVVIKKGNRS